MKEPKELKVPKVLEELQQMNPAKVCKVSERVHPWRRVNRHRAKRAGIAILAALLALTLAACSGGSGSNAQEANGAQPPEKLTNLTYWVQMVSQVSATLKSYNEIEAYKELERVTGVKVDFQHPPEGQQAKEQFNLMLTSDKLPDVIEYSWTSYPGGPEKAIKDGKIIRLNDLIDQHAPNLKKVLEEHPDWKKEIMTDEGSIYAFPFIRSHDRLKVYFSGRRSGRTGSIS